MIFEFSMTAVTINSFTFGDLGDQTSDTFVHNIPQDKDHNETWGLCFLVIMPFNLIDTKVKIYIKQKLIKCNKGVFDISKGVFDLSKQHISNTSRYCLLLSYYSIQS